MSDNIPEWLRPYCTQNSYTPTEEDIESLDPQSRNEMLLKYFALNYSGSGGDSGGGVDPSIIERTATNITADMLKGVTSIGSNAFYDYLSLTNVKIPNNVTSIGSQAFYNCRKLKSVKIPNSVTSIGGQAFEFCFSLVSVEIPNSVTSIDREAFYNCSGLISLTVKAATPPTLGDYAFKYTNAALVIYVPSESVDAYKAANNWSTYADKIQAIPSE